MAKLERWGKPYRDTRDWREYNEQLVKRGTLYLSLEFVEHWDQLVGHLNRGKRGHPFIYPGQFIQWLACIHSIFQMPYRQMEGFTITLSISRLHHAVSAHSADADSSPGDPGAGR